jgi:multidrug resistance efflux pump
VTVQSSVHNNHLAPLAALCAIARFHQVAADPATLAHQLGLSANQPLTGQVLVELDPTMATADMASVQEQLKTQASEVIRTR